MPVIDLKQTTISIVAGGVGETVEVKIGEGNLTYNERRNIEYIKDRGLLDTVREGDEEPVEVRMDFTWEYLSSDAGATVPTIEEALKRTGVAAAWDSTDADPCNPYAVDIVILFAPDCFGVGITNEDETITLADFRWESLEHDMRNGSVAVTGQCNVTRATIARTASS